jgi:hypothetical protein
MNDDPNPSTLPGPMPAGNYIKARFTLGQLVMTPGAMAKITQELMIISLSRHVRGDWGDVDKDDRAANEQAVHDNYRILSSYPAEDGEPFWIITEADRSSTTLLLPDEY